MRFSLIRLSLRQSTGHIPLCHQGWPPAPATAKLLDPKVLAVAVAHLTRGPSLRRVMLSAPIMATTASSDFRSALHHFTGPPLIGFAAAGHSRTATLEPSDAGAETDLSCSTMDCVIVPIPIRRRVPRCRISKIFAPSLAFAHPRRARLPLGSCSRRVP